jgi:uncharacterized protein (DUF2132 family)
VDHTQPKNPLHGVTLKEVLDDLVARYGWEELGALVPVRCFTHEPSINSSLKFLRKTPWARTKVEDIYVNDRLHAERRRKANQRRAALRAKRSEAAEAGASEGEAEGGE